MKLLFCTKCCDFFSLSLKEKTCTCKQSGGKYLDGFNAVYWGEAIPLGISNNSFVDALQNQPKDGWGRRFEAFVIPKECEVFIKKDKI